MTTSTGSSDSTVRKRFTVGDDDTAEAVGSGSLPVLGTPRLIAWMEAVTCEAIAPLLSEGATSVGTRIDIEHLAPSAVGHVVEVQVDPAAIDGRIHRFTVTARAVVDDTLTQIVAAGEITRAVVDATRFMNRLTG